MQTEKGGSGAPVKTGRHTPLPSTLKRLSQYVKLVDSTYYDEHRAVFDRANKN